MTSQQDTWVDFAPDPGPPSPDAVDVLPSDRALAVPPLASGRPVRPAPRDAEPFLLALLQALAVWTC